MSDYNPAVHDDSAVLIGASWYPEMWPKKEWPKDIARMKELGFTVVRMFEFAWRRLEPEEGVFDFDWAMEIMDLCAEAGINVMVGTPTAAPPAWLTSTYPEVLQIGKDGRQRTHGMRKHYSVYSHKYRELCAIITEKMAEAFSGCDALHSWQIDNEMGGSDFGPEAYRDFHWWLEQKYGDIDTLNETWGLNFWSQAYDRFDQIPIPTASVGSIEVPERHHPSLIMAAAHCKSDAWTGFIGNQTKIIRRYSDKPITTNMCGTPLSMDWFQNNRPLDRVGFSLYKDVDHYGWNLMHLDRMRAEKPAPYWLLETAPNWSGGGRMWNIHHSGAGVQAMSWLSTVLGGSMTLFWQWRQHWAGQEMLHGTHVTAQGDWRPGVEAWKKLARQYKDHGPWLMDNQPAAAKVGIVISTENAWGFSIDPMDDDNTYLNRWRDDYYQPLCKKHIWRDVICEEADFEKYDVLLLPIMPIVKPSTRQRLRDWVEAGGQLLLGPLTGFRTEEWTCHREKVFGGLEELIGADSALRFSPHWQEDKIKVVFDDGHESRTRVWCECFDARSADVLAHYKGGYGDGGSAVVVNHLGKGRVITLGCPVDVPTWLLMVNHLLDAAGIKPVAKGSEDVVVVPRADKQGNITGYGVVNLTEAPQQVTLPAGGTNLLTGNEVEKTLSLKPLEVVLVKI
ncbi:MAG: beta-galactosidase [Phycisphaerae bacterium]